MPVFILKGHGSIEVYMEVFEKKRMEYKKTPDSKQEKDKDTEMKEDKNLNNSNQEWGYPQVSILL